MFVCPECGQAQPIAGPCPSDRTPMAPIGEDMLLGTSIGVYRVARLLGIGGMGRVYKGVHPTIGSRVAIKVLSRECSDRRDLVDRFFAEAKAVNLIRHESIVNVLDLATLPDGRPYIIMEYLDGAPLATLIDQSLEQRVPLPLGGIARLAAEVLDALAAAHSKGIVHRDLKPDNVFVAPSGRPKVLDFGIAKLSDVSNTSTRTGSLLGTPHYMSPEQAAGRAVDHRADLYAIGVILFECSTGRKPFMAEALFDLLRMHVEAPPPPPRAMRPDMPLELEQVILTALAKAPEQRFGSAMAMSMALQHATAQLPPEQWRPLTPPTGRVGGHWAPTPPSSWSGPGSGSRPPTPQPPPPQPPPMGNASTVSAGQVTRGARTGSSRKALWALLGFAAIGGGITAGAVLAGRGEGDKGATSGTTTSQPVAPSGDDKDDKKDSKDPWSASAGKDTKDDKPAKDTTPWNASAGKDDKPAKDSTADDKDDTDDKDDDSADVADVAGDPLAQAFKQLDDTLKAMTPAQRRQFERSMRAMPAAQRKQFEAYRELAKLPPAERMKRLRAMGGLPGVAIPTPAGDTTPPPRPTGPAEADEPAPRPPGRWITNESIDPPPGYNPERVDVSAFIPWAVTQARKVIPDAQLIRIDSNGVGPDGRANLKLASHASDHGSIDVRFISPSRGKRDPNQPLGVGRRDFKCEFRIMATPEGVEMMPIDFADCSKEHVVPVPRCSAAGVWKKAIARKAPSQNAVGNVDYRSNGSRPVWYFAIGSGFDVVFSQTFGDDC